MSTYWPSLSSSYLTKMERIWHAFTRLSVARGTTSPFVKLQSTLNPSRHTLATKMHVRFDAGYALLYPFRGAQHVERVTRNDKLRADTVLTFR